MIIIYIFFIFIMVSALQPRNRFVIDVYFGVPGSGKSTFGAYLARNAMKESKLRKKLLGKDSAFSDFLLKVLPLKVREEVFSNYYIKGAIELDIRKDLGRHIIQNALIIGDELGIFLNSRDWKDLESSINVFLKKHRHSKVRCAFISQNPADMDINIRRVTQNFYNVTKSIIPFFVVATRYRRRNGVVGGEIKQIVQDGRWPFDCKYCFAPSVWKLFDTHEEMEGLVPRGGPDSDMPPWKRYGDDETPISAYNVGVVYSGDQSVGSDQDECDDAPTFESELMPDESRYNNYENLEEPFVDRTYGQDFKIEKKVRSRLKKK